MEKYIPLTLENLRGFTPAPVSFSIHSSIHLKTLDLLKKNCISGEEGDLYELSPYLLPSDFWAPVRVLYPHFGKLDNVAIIKSEFNLLNPVLPEQSLRATTRIVSLDRDEHQNARAIFLSKVYNSADTLVMQTIDTALLINDSPNFRYEERFVKYQPGKFSKKLAERKIYFRHTWEEKDWPNSMHVDAYAQKFGFRSGLPEFKIYVDWIYLAMPTQSTFIRLNLILPMYAGDIVEIWEEEQGNIVFTVEGNVRLKATFW